MKHTRYVMLALLLTGSLSVSIGCGGGSSEKVNYSGVNSPAVFDTTKAVMLAEELTLDMIHSEDMGGLGLVVVDALAAGGDPAAASLDVSAQPLAYSCESASFSGSISGTASGRACGDFEQGDLDFINADFINFSNVPGQLFQGGFSVEVGTTSFSVGFRDFSLKDGDLGVDLFLDGTMTINDPGSVYSVSFDLFVDNLLEGRGLYLNGFDLTVEDLGSSLLFTEIDIGSDYPKAGEVRFTGANGSSFRIVAEVGGFMVYVDEDGDGVEDWQTPASRSWTY
jgi:hypothetical protein